MIINYSTCYIGIQCQTNLFCLDWRQIRNGIVDCDYDEDEPDELCLQMDSNECHSEEEFRCKNGLCIPISLISPVIDAYFDRSDRKTIIDYISPSSLVELCLEYPSLPCDQTKHG
jgi:hypothetical protein